MASPDPHVNRTGLYTRTYYTVATLPAASSKQGEDAFVTDADASPLTFHGEIVAGSGEIRARVLSDGTNWRLAR
jgi:hypothetical protein